MTERRLRSRSPSLVREAGQETCFIETEANISRQETELNRTMFEANEEGNIVTHMQVKGHSDTSNNAVMSANQFHEFMNAVKREFDDIKVTMRSENTRLSENIKALYDEGSIKTNVANKSLSESLTNQLKEGNESFKKEFFYQTKGREFESN